MRWPGAGGPFSVACPERLGTLRLSCSCELGPVSIVIENEQADGRRPIGVLAFAVYFSDKTRHRSALTGSDVLERSPEGALYSQPNPTPPLLDLYPDNAIFGWLGHWRTFVPCTWTTDRQLRAANKLIGLYLAISLTSAPERPRLMSDCDAAAKLALIPLAGKPFRSGRSLQFGRTLIRLPPHLLQSMSANDATSVSAG
jgi:hypothetical protein